MMMLRILCLFNSSLRLRALTPLDGAKTIVENLGGRLRELRKQKGLSQRELAARAGLTNGMISLMETNKVNPTVSSLLKVLDAIPMSVVEFFQSEPPDQKQVFFGEDEMTDIGSNNVVLKLVGGKVAGRQIAVLHETYQPGTDTGREMMSHKGEEGGFVVRGEIEVTIGRQTRLLKPGEAYYFTTTMPHRFRNISDEICEIVSASIQPED